MGWYIRLEDKADVEWLQSLFLRQIGKWKAPGAVLPANLDTVERVSRVLDACVQAQPTDKASILGIPETVLNEDKTEQAERKKKAGKGSGPGYKPRHCDFHPTYTAARTPGKDCEVCWAAYKKLHPLEYDNARRRYERKKKNKAGSNS